jgi:hypothetical protein
MILSRTLLLSCCLAVVGSAWAEDKKLTLDELPAAVKAAALKQANGVAISEIEEETKKGKTVYEVTFGDTEVTLDANGKVLSTKVEKEDDEDDDEEDDKPGKDGKPGKVGKGADGEDGEDDDDDKDAKKPDADKSDSRKGKGKKED